MEKKSVGINAILNVIKQCCAILFPLITFPYVSRVLGVDNYGKVSFAQSIVSYFALIAAFGISTYAIREGARIRSNKIAFQEFSSQIFTINIITTVIAYVLLAILVIVWGRLENYLSLIIVFSLTMILTTVGTEWINSIYEDYQYITIRYILMHILSLILMFVLVKSPSDLVIYAGIVVLSNAGAYILNIFWVRKYVHLRLTRHPKIKKHFKPMLLLFFNAVSVQIYVNSDITILGILQDDVAVGIYSAAVRIYNTVKQLINAVIIVAIPRISALLGEKKQEEYNNLLEKTFHAILTLLLPAIVGIFMLSYEIIYVIGGVDYVSGYWALRILSVSLALAVFGNFYNNAILVTNKKEQYFLQGTVIASVSNIVLNIILIPYISYLGAAVTTVIAEGIVLGVGIFRSRGLYKINIVKSDVLSTVIGCVIIVITCIVIKAIIASIYIRIICCIVISVVAYCIILWIFKNRLLEYAINIVKVRVLKKR